jgi:hypothetical protein
MKPWEKYEETARLVLEQVKEHFGLESVQGSQALKGGLTSWNVDAKGITETGGIILIECRLRSRSANQEAIAALSFRIQDCSADGAIFVSPVSLQTGAIAVAKGTSIHHMMLDQSSTAFDFAFEFLGKLFVGIPGIASNGGFGTAGLSRG